MTAEFVVQETKTQYIAEVELCLSKTFQVMACPKSWQQQRSVDSYQRDGGVSMGDGSVAMVERDGGVVQRRALTLAESERCADTQPVAYPVIRHNSAVFR